MNELERYKKAYATLAGQVDTAVSKLKESEIMLNLLHRLACGLDMTVSELLDFPEMNHTQFEDE